MRSVNKVTLIGNVTRDAEVKITPNGQSIATFGLATNRIWKEQNGEKKSLPEFHNIVAWGQLAEFCGQNVRSGKPLYVEGYLKTRSWEAPDGQNKFFRTEIVIENLIFLSPKEEHTDVPA
ncbi:MAG: single-stranded DNA-binding protein [Candidatus Paceibacterota bacterium]